MEKQNEKGGASWRTSPRVRAHRLRLYEKVKELCPFRVIDFAVPYNVPTIYLFHSAANETIVIEQLISRFNYRKLEDNK